VEILQILPDEAPLTGGVGAVARKVGDALLERHGLASEYLRASELRGSAPGRPPGTSRVLVHYANYGYSRRGCPRWLIRRLERWTTTGAIDRLVTVFHELYATGPPSTSAFWLSPIQRSLARRLARTSTSLATSLSFYGSVLGRWSGRDDVRVLPVPSAVGEPESVAEAARRPARLVVFGSPGNRRRAYVEYRDALETTCEALALEEILDVGGPVPEVPEAVGGVPVRALGQLPDTEVSRLLVGSRVGFLAYPPDFLEKSSIFAAYAAHGLVPVCAWNEAREGGLRPFEEFLPARDLRRGRAPELAQAVARRARTWYLEHRLARQADTLFQALGG